MNLLHVGLVISILATLGAAAAGRTAWILLLLPLVALSGLLILADARKERRKRQRRERLRLKAQR